MNNKGLCFLKELAEISNAGFVSCVQTRSSRSIADFALNEGEQFGGENCLTVIITINIFFALCFVSFLSTFNVVFFSARDT